MCLDLENIYLKYIFSKITFSGLIFSTYISIKDLNHHNEDLIDYVNFWEGLMSIKFKNNEVDKIKSFKFDQSIFIINHY